MIPPTLDKELHDVIKRYIQEVELDLGFKLPNDEFIFINELYAELISKLAHRYVRGGIEHSGDGGSFFDVDHDRESEQEGLDGIHYDGGRRFIRSGRLEKVRRSLESIRDPRRT